MKKSLITERRTLTIIQLVIALSLIVLGVYMAGPWYVVDADINAFGLLAEDLPAIAHTIGVLYAVSGVVLAAGLIFHKRWVRRCGQWAAVISYTLLTATRLSTIGLIPFIWVFQLTVLLIIATIVLMDWGE